jgi:ribosomal protein L40E
MSKMLETPGTIVLAIGLLLMMVSLLLIVAGRWSGIGLFVVSVILLWVSVQWRGHEARIAASQAGHAPTVLQSEIREREIVKVKCRYCGALNPDGARNCGSCGAVL